MNQEESILLQKRRKRLLRIMRRATLALRKIREPEFFFPRLGFPHFITLDERESKRTERTFSKLRDKRSRFSYYISRAHYSRKNSQPTSLLHNPLWTRTRRSPSSFVSSLPRGGKRSRESRTTARLDVQTKRLRSAAWGKPGLIAFVSRI